MHHSHCGIAACDVNSHSSASFQFAPEVEDRFPPVKQKRSAKRKCITVLVFLFTSAIILCVAASLALILTQKPVNFDEIEGFTYGDSTRNPRFRGSQRKYPDKQYLSHSYVDIASESPRYVVTTEWLFDDSLLVKQGGDYYRIDPSRISSRQKYISSKDVTDSAEFNLNSDGTLVALSRVSERVFRHSKKFSFTVAAFHRGSFGEPQPVGLTNNDKIQFFSWNPVNGSSDFVFVKDNNIYYQNDPFIPTSAQPVTFTGSDTLYYGVPDWVYEEEIFGKEPALWWAKSGKYIAFTMIDDANVTKAEVPYYSNAREYPTYREIPYPKTGTKFQPSVTLLMWDKEMNVTQIVMPPELAETANSGYLFRAGWISLKGNDEVFEDYLIAVFANRDQNTVHITSCQFAKSCMLLKTIKFTMAGMDMWAEPTAFTIQYYSNSGFFIILPHEHTDGNVYNHVAHLEVTKQGKYYPVGGYHGGNYDVAKIVGYDPMKDELFFTTDSDSKGQTHLFKVPFASTEDNISPQCISCLIPDCDYVNDAKFSPSSTKMIIECFAPFTHAVAYLKMTNDILNQYVISDQSENVTRFNPRYSLPSTKFDKLTLSSGFEANYMLLLPPNFNSKNTYPVLLDVYSGPGTNKVISSTPEAHMVYFASVRDYIIVAVDGRGSGGRGWRIRQPIYKNFGGPEVIDQIDAVQLLTKKYSFMDPDRIAAFGWSYGGFVTAHIAARDAGNTVKCVVSVAPVVDFKFYDSAYTERYMLMPEENEQGYNANSLLNKTKIESFRHVDYLLAHGEADDNVHYQNSALLAYTLQKEDIHFTQLVYPNQDHAIGGARRHLINEVDLFLRKCFDLNYLK